MEIYFDNSLYFLGFFLFALCLGYGILTIFQMRKKFLIFCMFGTVVGHFLGSVSYWAFSPADAAFYFRLASPNLRGLGMDFMFNLLWYLKDLIFGENYFATYSFFAFLSSTGGVFYLICFYKLVLLLTRKYDVFTDFKWIKWGCILIACWPSSFFWASGIGKDTIIYFASSMFFLSLVLLSYKKISAILLCVFSAVLVFFIRPYLGLVGFVAFFCWILLGKKHKGGVVFRFLLVAVVFVVFISIADTISNFINADILSYDALINRAAVQQGYLMIGSHGYLPTSNPHLLIIFLPYLMFVNLFLPLFFWIRNIFGVFASIQNVLLLIFCYKFLKHWNVWKKIRTIPVVGYMFWYFLVGIALLGITNTNLGLADREKLMYLMPFLVVMFLVLSVCPTQNKNLVDNKIDKKERVCKRK